jgi:geranylgeranyl diphosphate synthase type I
MTNTKTTTIRDHAADADRSELVSVDEHRIIQSGLRMAVGQLDDRLRLVVSYHMGWSDLQGREVAADGGKSVRSALALLAARAAGTSVDLALPGAIAVELVHNFSLVHDDLIDRDTTRRHRATVWSLWDDTTAILAGDALLMLAFQVLSQAGSPHAPRASQVLGAAVRELIRGQLHDVDFERRNDVTLDECLAMAGDKTASLLAASATIGPVLAGAAPDVIDALEFYGRNIGVAFQLVDDLLGIWGEPKITGKPVFSDLRSRKKSLPVSWTTSRGGKSGRDLATWLECTEVPTDAELREAATLVERGGGREWAISEARRRVHVANQALARVSMPAQYRTELADLAHFIVERHL